MELTRRDVLIVVDVQEDFLPGGALPVPDGDAVVAPCNALGRRFAHVVLTQDWHPPGHASFASTYPGKRPLVDTIELSYGTQVLWPDHVIQGTPGAALAAGLDIPHADLILRKGTNPAIDSYSAFMEADRATTTGLAGYLRARGMERVFVCGLATDFCVALTALDAREAGFETFVVADAVRGIDIDGSVDQAWSRMMASGAHRITQAALA